MKRSRFKRYLTSSEAAPILYVESLCDDVTGLKIVLKSGSITQETTMIIHFEDYYGYRNFDESERYALIEEHSEIRDEWSLFYGENTLFSKWLVNEAGGKIALEDIIHFLIVTDDDVVEILSSGLPEIRFVNN